MLLHLFVLDMTWSQIPWCSAYTDVLLLCTAELQLKPTHVPFKLACYWEELLEKYTNADAQDIERDEPVLMFQRNVFFSRSKEKQVGTKQCL